MGGSEKISAAGLTRIGEVDVLSSEDARRTLSAALDRFRPDTVVDLSDEPVLDYRRRHELAAVALWHGVAYEGADFRFTPPARPRLARKPSLAVIGTGKRSGKTAVAGFGARTLRGAGYRPVVVAMGRGGPERPEVIRGDQVELVPADLLALAQAGEHAASDYIEDAFLARVPTVGCRRCGGGLAGGVEFTNLPEGIEIANSLDGDLMILEGSGAAIPPADADATGLVVPAHIPEEYLAGYMAPYKLLLADFVVVTMCENPFGSPSRVSAVVSRIERSFRSVTTGPTGRAGLRVVRTVFRPTPARDVGGADVFVATTAAEVAGEALKRHLETKYGCRVVGITHSLSDRRKLQAELQALGGRADVLLCEIKAAAIDVATKRALDEGLEVVYMDNVPVGVDGDDPTEVIEWGARIATERFNTPK